MGRITELIQAAAKGDNQASEHLFAEVYQRLRTIASAKMKHEPAASTLQPTALVNEVYLKLFRHSSTSITDRLHFFRLASEAMRQILIDAARRKHRLKRGGRSKRVPLPETIDFDGPDPCDLLDLDAALTQFESVSPENAELVKLHIFSELTIEQCANVLGVSVSTAERRWRFARAWLKEKMN